MAATFLPATKAIEPLPSGYVYGNDSVDSKELLEKKSSTSSSNDANENLSKWMKRRVKLKNYDSSMWFEKQNAVLNMFLYSPWISTLFIGVDTQRRILHVATEFQSLPKVTEVAFFLREKGAVITDVTASSTLQFGTFSVNQTATTVKLLLEKVFRPYIILSSDWTESARKDVDKQYHRLMISLTETANQSSGRTELYLPTSTMPWDVYANNGDNIQQFESIAIHWASQIKSLLNCQSDTLNVENSGIIEEINYWSRRAAQLADLSNQLKSDPVQNILRVLNDSNSSYVKPVRDLFNDIERNSNESEDTMKHLGILTDPCTQISKLPITDIAELFPRLFTSVHQISALSQYYNTSDKVSRLLQKISLEVIGRCCRSIPLENILTGLDVEKSYALLNSCIRCGETWNQSYREMADSINNSFQTKETKDTTGIRWDFEETALFAQVDAFIRRFQDLRDICDGFVQFVSSDVIFSEQQTLFSPPTAFILQKTGLFRSLHGIEVEFQQFVSELRSVKYDILDLQSFQWHEDMQKFKLHVKDLSSMYNVFINETFNSIDTISVAVEVLEAFHFLARTEEIRDCLLKQAHRVRILFVRQCDLMRSEFDERHRDSAAKEWFEPRLAGAARWAQSMSEYMAHNWNLLHDSKCKIVQENDEACTIKLSLMSALDLFKMQCFQTWTDKFQGDVVNQLQNRIHETLLRKNNGKGLRRAVACNFDADILELFDEAREWQKFPSDDYEIPSALLSLCHQHEHLVMMRERVMIAVQVYNDAHATPKNEDYLLFSDHLRQLEKKILPGLSKLNWGTKALLIERFVENCTKEANAVMKLMNEFSTEKSIINFQCQRIQQLGLLKVEKTLLYNGLSFEKQQSQHRAETEEKLKHCFLVVKATMKDMFMKFKDKSDDILREWNTQIHIVNEMIKKSLLESTKQSLKILLRAMNGGSATGESKILFVLIALLDSTVVQSRPTVIEVTHAINTVVKEMISSLKVIPSLTGHDFFMKKLDENGAENASSKSVTFYDSISNDEDVLQLVVKIMNETIRSATEVRNKLLFWDQFKNLWDIDKESFIRKYAKANQSLEAFDRDMAYHAKQQSIIRSTPNVSSVQFIKVDNSSFKATLLGHSMEWQTKLSGLLHRNGKSEVQRLHETMERNVSRLTTVPIDTASLSDLLDCKDQWNREFDIFQKNIDHVEGTYLLLSKHNVMISDQENQLVSDLRSRWAAFQETLNGADALISRGKKHVKKDVDKLMMEFHANVNSFRDCLKKELPTMSVSISLSQIFSKIESHETEASVLHQQEANLRSSCALFGIDTHDAKDLILCNRDLEFAREAWVLYQEWTQNYTSWRHERIKSIDETQISITLMEFNKRLTKLKKHIGEWSVCIWLKKNIEAVNLVIPLVAKLKNETLRDRHFAMLYKEMGRIWSFNSVTFGEIITLELNNYSDFIQDLCAEAEEEFSIEATLERISTHWTDLKIECKRYKNSFLISSSEELQTMIDGDVAELRSVKSSRFSVTFKEEIDSLEQKLFQISEAVDSILGVQLKWMFAENVFLSGAKDIQDQLSQEYQLFLQVNKDFADAMETIHNDPSTLLVSSSDTFVKMKVMDQSLESIKKGLEHYMELR